MLMWDITKKRNKFLMLKILSKDKPGTKYPPSTLRTFSLKIKKIKLKTQKQQIRENYFITKLNISG